MILVALGIAPTQANHGWTTLLSTTFPILAVPELAVSCTGWFAAPRGEESSLRVSVYVTAGHCPAPQVIRTTYGFEHMAILAQISRRGADATVGLRMDPRPERTFLALAAESPRADDLALVAGYSGGHLTEAILTVLEHCPADVLCFHSDKALRPGMSGAPIMSLRSGDIVGILVAIARDARGHEDPHTIMATPARLLRTVVEIAAPEALHGRSLERLPAVPILLKCPSAGDTEARCWVEDVRPAT